MAIELFPLPDGTMGARFSRPLWSCDFSVLTRLWTVNELLRAHWRKRMAYRQQLAWAIHLALPPADRPRKPLEHCKIVVERHSAGTPDPEGLSTTIKPVLDILQVRSRRHPYGLDVLTDDTEAVVGKPVVLDFKCKPRLAYFRVQITELPPHDHIPAVGTIIARAS